MCVIFRLTLFQILEFTLVTMDCFCSDRAHILHTEAKKLSFLY